MQHATSSEQTPEVAADGEYEVDRVSPEGAETHVDMLAQLAHGRRLLQSVLQATEGAMLGTAASDSSYRYRLR